MNFNGRNLIFINTEAFDEGITGGYNVYRNDIGSLEGSFDSSTINNRNTLFVLSEDESTGRNIDLLTSYLNTISPTLKLYILLISENEKTEWGAESVFQINKKTTHETISVVINLIFDKMLYRARIDDYIVKSFNIIVSNNIIEKQKNEIEALYSDLEKLSKIDSLTQVLNRKAFFESLETEKKRTLRGLRRIEDYKAKGNSGVHLEEHFGKFSCIMVDIDHFKNVNDTYGHLVGDKVLRRIGEIMRTGNIFRDNDIIGRFGGEEFIIILPATGAKNAVIPAARLAKSIREEFFFNKDNERFIVTISIGISEFNPEDDKADLLIDRADKALYYSKENGRDRITVYEETFT